MDLPRELVRDIAARKAAADGMHLAIQQTLAIFEDAPADEPAGFMHVLQLEPRVQRAVSSEVCVISKRHKRVTLRAHYLHDAAKRELAEAPWDESHPGAAVRVRADLVRDVLVAAHCDFMFNVVYPAVEDAGDIEGQGASLALHMAGAPWLQYAMGVAEDAYRRSSIDAAGLPRAIQRILDDPVARRMLHIVCANGPAPMR